MYKIFRTFLLFILLAIGVHTLSSFTTASASEVVQTNVDTKAISAIPKESIRLRILANTDSDYDQQVKREIRDKVVQQVDTWVASLEDPQSLEQAREHIRTHLPELEQLVREELKNRQLRYSYKVELGVVPFPTKMYGDQVYPAGNYEALRITLGKGEGQNWWCVLFPPLCFIDADTGEAVAQVSNDEGAPLVTEGEKPVTLAVEEKQDTEIRFFLWDWIQQLVDWVKEIF